MELLLIWLIATSLLALPPYLAGLLFRRIIQPDKKKVAYIMIAICISIIYTLISYVGQQRAGLMGQRAGEAIVNSSIGFAFFLLVCSTLSRIGIGYKEVDAAKVSEDNTTSEAIEHNQ